MIKTDLEAVLASLTLEEKISLLAGENFWETVPIPGKVPKIKMSDGPNGARGETFSGGITSACFPAASNVAGTWDLELANRIGQALAEETHSKGARCLLAPTTCIHRHPLGGRNFESFSEDPLLSGKLASQVVQGLQSRGVAAAIKHFAANEQETDRMTVDETVSERALREIYLRPFEIAVKEANPWSIMTSYNMVNGVHADSNPFLFKVLREDWGFKGLAMSDWGGTNSTADSLRTGLELEMPGPTLKRKIPDVLAAIKDGKLKESDIDDRVRIFLVWLDKLKAFDDATIPPEQAIDKPEHRALIREVGARGCVLLKNDKGVLPLTKEKVKGKKIALFGFAKTALAHGGGSASLNAHYKITPWDALHTAYGDSAELIYAQGAQTERLLVYLKDDKTVGSLRNLNGEAGWTMTLLESATGKLAGTQSVPVSNVSPLLSDTTLNKAVELVADWTPVETGAHYMGCTGLGPTQVFINDQLVHDQKDNSTDPMGFLFGAISEEEFTYPFEEGKSYRIKIVSQPPTASGSLEILAGRSGLRFGLQLVSEHDRDLQAEAVAIAESADYAIVFTGHDPQWETEGQDQASFHLPRNGSLDGLVAAVAAANPNTVVVNSTGVAVALPWLDQVSGLLHTSFPGQECGNAIADVLTGAVNPEGHLSVSFPKAIEDAPAHGNFPGEVVDGRRQVEYKEGVFVGYRHYDRLSADKLNFPFGYGLSYSTFELGGLGVAAAGPDAASYTVTAEVTNTGAAHGGTLVQIYAGPSAAPQDQPVKQLVAFQKVRLQPGETKTVQLPVAARDFGYFDEARGLWVVAAGQYDFYLGKSAQDIVQKAAVLVDEELTFAP
ncbi:family 3 glycoside hydrolase [Xylariales sp. PMI_506]|nr:family 3 glycoside hydrolase [Xylariales sp. PMI_506]